jgi:hypothetical protein
MPSSERTAAYAELKLDSPGSAASISSGCPLKWRQPAQDSGRTELIARADSRIR